MSCPEHHELQDLVDDALSRAARERLESHLANCPDCRAEMAEIEDLVTAARELAGDEVPRRDLWPAIEAEIRRGGPSAVRRVSWLGLAAAAMLVAALTWIVASRDDARPPMGTDEPVVASTQSKGDVRVAAERARSEGGQLHVRADLLRSLALSEDRLDPATRELVDRNMEIIERAVGEIAAARAEYPHNRTLGSLLARIYQREAALLKQINRL